MAEIPGDLQKLALEAKDKLAAQFPEGAPTSQPVDMYAEFRTDSVNPDTKVTNQEHVTLQHRPTEMASNPILQGQPDPEYYQQEPVTLAPYDEEIFPGGPTITQVDSWKKQYPECSVYCTEISGQWFVFRTINRFEYKQLVALKDVDPLHREEIICETCTLWPAQYDWSIMATDKAGIPSTLATIIMEKSGFTKDYIVQVL